mmetsp:Transcript_22030/g.41501  ORF Transcript_22030/g.41501 Transcript_22030/m.41501 type:complete len:212 (-) Transcript_22030:156-791(-)
MFLGGRMGPTCCGCINGLRQRIVGHPWGELRTLVLKLRHLLPCIRAHRGREGLLRGREVQVRAGRAVRDALAAPGEELRFAGGLNAQLLLLVRIPCIADRIALRHGPVEHALRSILETCPGPAVLDLRQLHLGPALRDELLPRVIVLQREAIPDVLTLIRSILAPARPEERRGVPPFLVDVVLIVAQLAQIDLVSILVAEDVVTVSSQSRS